MSPAQWPERPAPLASGRVRPVGQRDRPAGQRHRPSGQQDRPSGQRDLPVASGTVPLASGIAPVASEPGSVAIVGGYKRIGKWITKEPPVGFEPTTSRLLSGCSAN